MKRVQSRPINNGRLMSQEHTLTVVEAVNYYSSRIAKLDLENRLLILMPPVLFSMVRLFQEPWNGDPTSQTVA